MTGRAARAIVGYNGFQKGSQNVNAMTFSQTQRLAAMNDPSQILGDHNAQMNRLNNLALPESTQLTTAQRQRSPTKGRPGYKVPGYTGFVANSREEFGSSYGAMTSTVAAKR